MNKTSRKTSVLFVCMGNICRSPAAEGVFREYISRSGHDGLIDVDSAGTIDSHAGSPADPRMRKAASARGYRLDSIARQVRTADIENFDLVIAMDHDNLAALQKISSGPSGHIRLLGSFIGDPGTSVAGIPAVPDPYYGGDDGFEKVLDMIESACPGILQHSLDISAEPPP